MSVDGVPDYRLNRHSDPWAESVRKSLPKNVSVDHRTLRKTRWSISVAVIGRFPQVQPAEESGADFPHNRSGRRTIGSVPPELFRLLATDLPRPSAAGRS